MLDNDVARLYEYETKQLNRTVKRNIERFPENFCFQLTLEEYNLWCQNGTAKINDSMRRTLPYVFTEYGITMLAGLLKSNTAIKISIEIVNAFIEMRKFIFNNAHIFERLTNIEYKMLDYDKKFDILFDELQKDKVFEQKIFYDGQIYDSFSLIIDIIRTAENEIIIIDNYIDKNIIDILSFKNNDVTVTIFTDFNKLNNIIIEKFNNQYPYLKIVNSNIFHDRFIIIDNKEIYHIGASLKDIGKKCFAISKIEDGLFIEHIVSIIDKV